MPPWTPIGRISTPHCLKRSDIMQLSVELNGNRALLEQCRKWVMSQVIETMDEAGLKSIMWYGTGGFLTMPADAVAAILDLQSRSMFRHIDVTHKRHHMMLEYIETQFKLFPEDFA